MLNKQLSGKFSFQNPVGKEFSVNTGQYTKQGQSVYVEPFGSAVDFAALPFALIHGLFSGYSDEGASLVRNRLSAPVGSVLDQLTNSNYTGQPLYPQGASMGQQLLGRGTDLARTVVPPQAVAAGQVLTGQQTPLQGLSSAILAPVRYSGGGNTPNEQAIVKMGQQGGTTGSQIAGMLNNYKQAEAAKYHKCSHQVINQTEYLIKFSSFLAYQKQTRLKDNNKPLTVIHY